jgi:hypothetical protein
VELLLVADFAIAQEDQEIILDMILPCGPSGKSMTIWNSMGATSTGSKAVILTDFPLAQAYRLAEIKTPIISIS